MPDSENEHTTNFFSDIIAPGVQVEVEVEVGDGYQYYVFVREGIYQVLALDPIYDHPSAQKGEYTGWYFTDEELARKFAYLLNHTTDPLATKYLADICNPLLS